jgi:uncharacterized protein YijF (DUF1287 family)
MAGGARGDGALLMRIQASAMLLLILPAGALAQPPRDSFSSRLVAAAIERTTKSVTYDGSYRRLEYPGGDVPDDIGVCTDLIVRSYRAVGIDLQQLVHEDMKGAFTVYPQNWGLTRPDPNIDHRRVPNLQVFFSRHGTVLENSSDPADYHAGDIVTWALPGDLPHIGIVTHLRSSDGARPLVAHNLANGPELEDMLFGYRITGHYRYTGSD